MTFDPEHWQLDVLELLDTHPMDYRVNDFLLEKNTTIGELHDYLNQLYAGSVGVEFEHVHNEEERLWLYENYEKAMLEPITPSEKLKML